MGTSLSVARGWLRDSSARHPMFAAALVSVASVIAADVSPWLGFLIAGVFALIGMAYASRWRGMAWFICGGIAAVVFVSRAHTQQLAEKNLLAQEGGTMEAYLLADGRGSGMTWSAPAKLRGGSRPSHAASAAIG